MDWLIINFNIFLLCNKLTDKIRIKEKNKELIIVKKEFESFKDPTLKKGITSKKNNTDLFDVDDISEVNGVFIWNGEDMCENEPNDNVGDE